MTWDPLLSDDWPADWTPFTVEVRSLDGRLTLVGAGTLDAWTAGTLLRTLVAVHESHAEVHLDLHQVHAPDGAVDEVIRQCRAFVEGRRSGFIVAEPRSGSGQRGTLAKWSAASAIGPKPVSGSQIG